MKNTFYKYLSFLLDLVYRFFKKMYYFITYIYYKKSNHFYMMSLSDSEFLDLVKEMNELLENESKKNKIYNNKIYLN